MTRTTLPRPTFAQLDGCTLRVTYTPATAATPVTRTFGITETGHVREWCEPEQDWIPVHVGLGAYGATIARYAGSRVCDVDLLEEIIRREYRTMRRAERKAMTHA